MWRTTTNANAFLQDTTAHWMVWWAEVFTSTRSWPTWTLFWDHGLECKTAPLHHRHQNATWEVRNEVVVEARVDTSCCIFLCICRSSCSRLLSGHRTKGYVAHCATVNTRKYLTPWIIRSIQTIKITLSHYSELTCSKHQQHKETFHTVILNTEVEHHCPRVELYWAVLETHKPLALPLKLLWI